MIKQDELKSKLHYDPETGIFTWLISPTRSVKAGDNAGCLTSNGYVRIRINKKLYVLQRLAWLYFYGEIPTNQIDHIDGDRSNNKINNLRIATNAQNCQNRRNSPKNNTSGRMGVSFHKATNKWRARIMLNYKEIHIGMFTSKECAYKAYVEKKREVHEYSTL